LIKPSAESENVALVVQGENGDKVVKSDPSQVRSTRSNYLSFEGSMDKDLFKLVKV